jgi:hypothetical protein
LSSLSTGFSSHTGSDTRAGTALSSDSSTGQDSRTQGSSDTGTSTGADAFGQHTLRLTVGIHNTAPELVQVLHEILRAKAVKRQTISSTTVAPR